MKKIVLLGGAGEKIITLKPEHELPTGSTMWVKPDMLEPEELRYDKIFGDEGVTVYRIRED